MAAQLHQCSCMGSSHMGSWQPSRVPPVFMRRRSRAAGCTQAMFSWGKNKSTSNGTSTSGNISDNGTPGPRVDPGPDKVYWYQKNLDAWSHELHTKEEIASALNALPSDKLLVVDYYASWCAVCKAAYPNLCRIVTDEANTKHFVFAKASLDNEEIKQRIREESIVGIPWMSVYAAGGRKVVGFGASFKKLEMVKKNLAAVAARKDRVLKGEALQLDPNGFVICVGEQAAAVAPLTPV